jgi:hypothetical protein
MNKIKITAYLETSDHDGYCSGNECEYKKTIIEHIFDFAQNENNKNLQLGLLNDYNENDWIKYLPEPKLNLSGSYYCDCYLKNKYGLNKHDYKYKIKSIEIIE